MEINKENFIAGAMCMTFLGTGTSTGVPMIACDCAVCLSENPKNQRLRCSIYVETPTLALMVDTGPDFRTQCLREKIHRADAVLMTHSHLDHIAGFDDLRRFSKPEKGLDVYANRQTLESLQRIYPYTFVQQPKSITYLKVNPHIFHEKLLLGDLEIRALPVFHGDVDTMGFLFTYEKQQRLAYIPDCKSIPPETIAFLQNIDTLVLDALHERPHPTHLSFQESIEIAKLIDARQTFFTHTTHEIDYEIASKKLPAKIFIAYDGLKLTW